MSWHADGKVLERYAGGNVDAATAVSLEAHLVACPACRDAALSHLDPAPLERIWNEVRRTVDQPTRRTLERALTRVGVRDHTARLLAMSSTLSGSWLIAVAMTMAFAVFAAHVGGGGALFFLIAAPLAPVAGVAFAFHRSADPLHEIGLSSAMGGFRLLLTRAISVVLVSVVITGIAALGLPQVGWTAAAWLLPSLALSAITLTASATTVAAPSTVASAVAATWVGLVLVVERLAAQPYAAFGPVAQFASVCLVVVAVLVLVVRRGAVEVRARL
jgi:hypothetical protein